MRVLNRINHMKKVTDSQFIKAAAVDFICDWGNLEDNIDRLKDAVIKVKSENINYAVFPETCVSGYIFSDYTEMEPYFDTIPGKTTDALLPILKGGNTYVSIGIAEKDLQTGLAYNAAVLLGPDGIIGKYRKIGLNSQDQKIFSPGNLGIPVFDTPIGQIALLICYDDTYWQYARLAALKGAQIIGWHSVSDRMMPNANASDKLTDHSTIAQVQHMSALNGVWVICATRSGIEINPITKSEVYYNGGSSIWSPLGHKVAQGPVVSPNEMMPGLNGIYSAILELDDADKQRERSLMKRKPNLYCPILALHRSPTDINTTKKISQVDLSVKQCELDSPLVWDEIIVKKDGLLVLPQFISFFDSHEQSVILNHAEKMDGEFEHNVCTVAKKGQGYVVGSYPEIDADKVYHTVVLAGPEGAILSRYRATHLDQNEHKWAHNGDTVSLTETPIGRIALALAHELEVPELGGIYCALRADIIAAPAGKPSDLKVEIDPRLFAVDSIPTGIADFVPYAAAFLNQLWVACGGYRVGDFSSAAIYGPEPVMLTSTRIASKGQSILNERVQVPGPYTWINQERLISGQQTIWFTELVK